MLFSSLPLIHAQIHTRTHAHAHTPAHTHTHACKNRILLLCHPNCGPLVKGGNNQRFPPVPLMHRTHRSRSSMFILDHTGGVHFLPPVWNNTDGTMRHLQTANHVLRVHNIFCEPLNILNGHRHCYLGDFILSIEHVLLFLDHVLCGKRHVLWSVYHVRWFMEHVL